MYYQLDFFVFLIWLKISLNSRFTAEAETKVSSSTINILSWVETEGCGMGGVQRCLFGSSTIISPSVSEQWDLSLQLICNLNGCKNYQKKKW